MIKIGIAIQDGKIYDEMDKKDTNLEEVSVVVFRLEQIKQELLSIKFKSEFEASSNDGEDDGE